MCPYLSFLPRQSVSNFVYRSPFFHAGLGRDHNSIMPSPELPWPACVRNPCCSRIFSLIQGSVRFFLGLAEGAVFPGVAYYVSLWYPRRMHAKRVAFVISFASMSGAFSGLLAYAIEHLDGYGTVRSSQISLALMVHV